MAQDMYCVYEYLLSCHTKMMNRQVLDECDRAAVSEFLLQIFKKGMSISWHEEAFLVLISNRISEGKPLNEEERNLVLAYLGTALECAHVRLYGKTATKH